MSWPHPFCRKPDVRTHASKLKVCPTNIRPYNARGMWNQKHASESSKDDEKYSGVGATLDSTVRRVRVRDNDTIGDAVHFSNRSYCLSVCSVLVSIRTITGRVLDPRYYTYISKSARHQSHDTTCFSASEYHASHEGSRRQIGDSEVHIS